MQTNTKRFRWLPFASYTVAIIWSCSLVGCIYIVNNIEKPGKQLVKKCAVFHMPVLKPIPGVPIITDADLKNKDKTDTILVNKIDELREYNKYMQIEIQNAVTRNAETCE